MALALWGGEECSAVHCAECDVVAVVSVFVGGGVYGAFDCSGLP